jgi:hypothetical protein
MKDFISAYIECALWTDAPDDRAGILAEETRRTMKADAEAFYNAHATLIENNPRQAGHAFWLTRNRHGAGFWDGDWPEPMATVLTEASHAAGERDLYCDSDGLIYTT